MSTASQSHCLSVCAACQGRGKKSQGVSKKRKRTYQHQLAEFRKTDVGTEPEVPKGHFQDCSACLGTGLCTADYFPEPDTERFPRVAIIGAGIGGMALAVACLHRGIPFYLFERDSGFEVRSQGYGLTLQQASRALAELGIESLTEGVYSTRHVVHATDGTIVADWGLRERGMVSTPDGPKCATQRAPKRTNVHIARQSLRRALMEQLAPNSVHWGHQLVGLELLDFESVQSDPVHSDSVKAGAVQLHLQCGSEPGIKTFQADLVVGADGIRSAVRGFLSNDFFSSSLKRQGGCEPRPINYLNCIVILGICPLDRVPQHLTGPNSLLDGATVFQTANGHERIYMMPFDQDSVMWQLSFPLLEAEAKNLSEQGAQALKREALKRCQWHAPIPDILAATEADKITGYPVYDRDLLAPESGVAALNPALASAVTLMGDALHPMSPFKGQGANQALLDALAVARAIYQHCAKSEQWRQSGLRTLLLADLERDILTRAASKVKGSAQAAEFLHSDIVLHKANEPRGRCLQAASTEKTPQ